MELKPLAEILTRTIEDHHLLLMEDQDRLKPSDYIDEDDIWRILYKIYTIDAIDDVFKILGCDILPGGVEKIYKCIAEWKLDSVGVQAIREMRTREAAIRVQQAETLARLQKQQEEREKKAQEARTLKEEKKKRLSVDRLAESAAKKIRKEESQKRKDSVAHAKAIQEANRAANARMIAGLAAGKSMFVSNIL
ncbi:uncharacterized protein MELLADRAFT_85128 [Melampsora larici-populina 98AG31]|uniref:Uncharacterized protein n=1 Tax=Melampsora larici-populina (strain 98AG31 / pathotype 3-4-7) TaxID=747676 RepID=F4RHK7_MELLP|nr:uncharacterized protein MELLADRAFT_85128 [Melampsora larici-populina 98AG31]EGG07846.1 hypothetical protein MELLADRAFT_85128 [Melampsora larici-populina 98AG31]